MRFAVFDHSDASGRPPATQLAERLALVEAYERLGFYGYQMAEHVARVLLGRHDRR